MKFDLESLISELREFADMHDEDPNKNWDEECCAHSEGQRCCLDQNHKRFPQLERFVTRVYACSLRNVVTLFPKDDDPEYYIIEADKKTARACNRVLKQITCILLAEADKADGGIKS